MSYSLTLDTDHPTPQLARAHWIDLRGPWQFAYDDADAGVAQQWPQRADVFDRTIQVPYPPESRASGIGQTGYHPVMWYRRVVTLHADDAGRWTLCFGAVDYQADVWVNGQHVANHSGGHTPFAAEIGAALRRDSDEQVIIVRAEDQPQDLTQPRGKQDWQPQPHEIWYHRTSGIWQAVWIEPLAAYSIAALRWTPIADQGQLRLTVRLNRMPVSGLRLRVQLATGDLALVDDTYSIGQQETERTLTLVTDTPVRWSALLWSPGTPTLIAARLTLLAGEQVLDEVTSYAGLRSVGVEQGRFVLNGTPTFLKLVLGQNYWPETHLAAPDDAALRREVELIKALGFNGVRIHQKVEDPRFLYWCDRLGLLVWGEMANAYAFSPLAVERLTREWMEVMARDVSHPCIVTWVPLNESWGVPALARDPAQRAFIQALYTLTKALDPTRPVIGNDGWEHVAGDMRGIHDYSITGDVLQARYITAAALAETIERNPPQRHLLHLDIAPYAGEPVVISEFGGISYRPEKDDTWWGYGTVADADELLARYADLVNALLACPMIAGFCYTQLTDTLQENNGLLTAERTPKIPLGAIAAINAQPAQAIGGDVIGALHDALKARARAARAAP